MSSSTTTARETRSNVASSASAGDAASGSRLSGASVQRKQNLAGKPFAVQLAALDPNAGAAAKTAGPRGDSLAHLDRIQAAFGAENAAAPGVDSGASVQRRQASGAPTVQMDEAAEKVTATNREAADGGHSLVRHGPEVSEGDLERRLKTGMTAKADGSGGEVFSPAPGFASKFATFAAVNKTRTAAATEANDGLATTLAGVNVEAGAVTTKNTELKTAKDALDKADAPGKAAAGKAFGLARAALTGAETTLRNKARTFDPAAVPGVPVSYEKPEPATDGLEYLRLRPSYKVVKNHGEVIGVGIRGDKKDLTDTHGEGGAPHENVYETVKAKEDVSSTQTAFNAAAGKKLSTIDPTTEANAWSAGQHYPCAPEEPAGIS